MPRRGKKENHNQGRQSGSDEKVQRTEERRRRDDGGENKKIVERWVEKRGCYEPRMDQAAREGVGE